MNFVCHIARFFAACAACAVLILLFAVDVQAAVYPPHTLDSSLPPWPNVVLERLPGDYQDPVHLADPEDGSGRLFVVEKRGTIRIYEDGAVRSEPFLDIHNRVNANCSECGLLSVAFPPDFAAKGYFFVYYNSKANVAGPDPIDTEANGGKELDSGNDTVIARFRLSSNPNVADPASEEHILTRNQPYSNHNGGLIVFGPNGFLYIGLGDGGSGNDPLNSGQRTNTLLGKILRIQVGASGTYTIPEDNPFVDEAAYEPEIWTMGLRNPWRFSFDRLNGDLYIGDVGQNAYEEIDYQPAASKGGENYGWKLMEGDHCVQSGCDQSGLVSPVVEYGRSQGHSVTGGAVYRGDSPGLYGIYLYADYVTGRIWGLRKVGSDWSSQELLDTNLAISSFGEDADGNMYVVDYQGGIYRIESASPNSVFIPYVRR